LDAAAFGVADDMAGVTQAVMLGQTAAIGTGFFDLYLDPDALSQVMPASKLHPSMLPYGAEFGSGMDSPFGLGAGEAGSTPYAGHTPSNFQLSPGVSPGASPWGKAQFAASPMGSPGISSPAYAR